MTAKRKARGKDPERNVKPSERLKRYPKKTKLYRRRFIERHIKRNGVVEITNVLLKR